jgi:hypothetical protein
MEPDVRRAAPGRLPERVYWFRRAFVLVCLVLIIALLMWLVSLIAGGRRRPLRRPRRQPPPRPVPPHLPDSLQATALPARGVHERRRATATDQPTTPPVGGPASGRARVRHGCPHTVDHRPGAVKAGATRCVHGHRDQRRAGRLHVHLRRPLHAQDRVRDRRDLVDRRLRAVGADGHRRRSPPGAPPPGSRPGTVTARRRPARSYRPRSRPGRTWPRPCTLRASRRQSGHAAHG